MLSADISFEGEQLGVLKIGYASSRVDSLATASAAAGEAQAQEIGAFVAAVRSESAKKSIMIALTTSAIGAMAIYALTLMMIGRPLRGLSSSMSVLADGDFTHAPNGQHRQDEIGMMARAVEVFRVNAERYAADESARAQREAEVAAEAEKRQRAREEIIGGEIVTLVQKVVKGDLSHRLSVSDKTGIFSDVCTQINRLVDSVDAILGDVTDRMQRLASGDLSGRLSNDYEGEFGRLGGNVNRTADELSRIVQQIQLASKEVSAAASEIASGTGDLSQRTEQAASNLEETAASAEEMAATVKQNAENANDAKTLASSADLSAKTGGEVVEQAVNAMAEIEQSAQKITDIIGVIDEIAFQTNLLALNASVEAARAGEAGKGFAVVAQEVRQLAQRSAQAASDIKTLIQDSNSQVSKGVDLVHRAGEALGEIVGSIGKVAGLVREIASASQEQAAGVQEINGSINRMDEMTQQNSALVEESTAAARALSNQAGRLTKLMTFFESDGDATADKSTETRTPLPALAAVR